MERALHQARLALEEGEVPVGCVFMQGDTVLAQGHNRTNADANATRHAEIVAIQQCADPQLLAGSTLYVTCEPCAMCASAISLVKVHKVVFGCKNDRFGGCGSVVHLHTQLEHRYHVEEGVMQEDAIELFREFYARGNPNGKIFVSF